MREPNSFARTRCPRVIGMHGRVYVIDHHHLGRAARESRVETGFFEIQADLSSVAATDFWHEMEKNLWIHPLDEIGVRHYYSSIPAHPRNLIDVPYRSLAGYVRYAGGFEKTSTPSAEFAWADFFWRTVPIELVRADFTAAVEMAVPLAHGHLAKALP